MKQDTARVTQLTFDQHLGRRRKRRGRKKSPNSGVPHLTREEITPHVPAHITKNLMEGLPPLRQDVRAVIHQVLREMREQWDAGPEHWFHVVHFAILDKHIHLIVEGSDRATLSNGLNSLFARMAKALNKLWGRSGTVSADRFHEHLLRTPREVRNAIRYVFANARKHGIFLRKDRPDPFSSGMWFDGWKSYVYDGWMGLEGPVAKARSWLLSKGWRRYGLLDLPWA